MNGFTKIYKFGKAFFAVIKEENNVRSEIEKNGLESFLKKHGKHKLDNSKSVIHN